MDGVLLNMATVINRRWFRWLGKLSLVAVLSAAVLVSGCVPVTGVLQARHEDGGELTSVKQSGILVISTDPDYAPQSQLKADEPRQSATRCDMTQYTANQLEGFDVDVAKEVARRLGVEPCFVVPTWSQIVVGDWGDRWDINVGSMVITSERVEKLYFTQPYISGAAVVFVHKDNQTIHKVADLSGKRIGVCAGCAYEAYLKGALAIPGEKIKFQVKNATAVGYDTDNSALADLAAGDGLRLDAVMTDPDTGQAAMQSGLTIRQLDEVVYHDYSAIAVDKRTSRDPLPLVRRLNEIVQEMHSDGTLLALSKQYYGGDFTTPAAEFDIDALNQYP